MVARSMSTAERFVPPPAPFIAGKWRLPRFTRRDAETLVNQGIIPEDASTELLHGLIVLKDRSARDQEPHMVGNDHTKCVERFSDLRIKLNDGDRHVRPQQPLLCSDTHVPEPDFMVLRGKLEDYADLPVAGDAFCVVEVADSSYERDTQEKLVGYARAGVAQYVVVNLQNRTAEVYVKPDEKAGTYPPPQIIKETGELKLRVGKSEFLAISLRELLP